MLTGKKTYLVGAAIIIYGIAGAVAGIHDINTGFEKALEGWETYKTKGLRRVNPFVAMAQLCNMSAHHVSLPFQCQSYNNTVVTACAAGTQAIGDAIAEALFCGIQ